MRVPAAAAREELTVLMNLSLLHRVCLTMMEERIQERIAVGKGGGGGIINGGKS